MVLKNTESTIAYRCPHCGSGILAMVGVFALSGDMIKLKCTCGCSELVMQKAEEEKIRLCEVVSASGADFIKTSTGFSTAGATLDDVRLMRANVGKEVLVKAAGGISGIQDAEDFINLGASRLGTSRVVKAVQGLEGSGY